RLVYADWLDEHGEWAHAELIRVQCALARMPFAKQIASPLGPRLNRAWRGCEEAWSLEMMNVGFVDVIHFRRGFLDEPLEMDAETFLTRSPLWWPRFPVQRVSLALDAPDYDWSDCEYLPRLDEMAMPCWCDFRSVRSLLLKRQSGPGRFRLRLVGLDEE